MENPINLALIVVTFGLLAGSVGSQRARCALAYFGVPTLCVFAIKRSMFSSFSLVEELTFYASYHADWRNQLIHIVFVPLLLFTAMIFFAYAPPLSSARPLGMPLNWATLAALGWSVHHVYQMPLVGLFAAAVSFGSALIATALVQRETAKVGAKGAPAAKFGRAALWAGALHALGWYMQLHPGHAIFEGRKAALVDALVQSMMDAPLFIWAEVAFALGYDPALHAQLNQAVAAQHAAWAAASVA
jgi:uncharacterized membrane protein YGL010W